MSGDIKVNPNHPNVNHPVYKGLCLFEAIMRNIEAIAHLGVLDAQEDATLADISDAIQDLQVRWGNRNAKDLTLHPEKAVTQVITKIGLPD